MKLVHLVGFITKKQPHIFLLKKDYMYWSINTFIRSPLQNAQNKSKYSGIIFATWDPTCVTTVMKM